MGSTPTTLVESCPVCEADAIDTSVTSFAGVCTQCGFVIHDETDTSVPERLVVSTEEEQPSGEEWLSTCRVQNATEQRLAEAFESLEDLAATLSIPIDVRREAADVYCDAFLAGVTDGRDTLTMVAACVRLASIQASQPIPVGRLTDSAEIDGSQFHQTCAILQDELEHPVQAPDPVTYLGFLKDELTIPEKTVQASTQLLEEIAGHSAFVGKDPSGIAAAGLYATSEEFTQADVATAVGVSTETVRKRVAQLREVSTDE